jgi:GntR family transcriptional regulator, transcriptional repressor for pyruvate dehydrogenase complex
MSQARRSNQTTRAHLARGSDLLVPIQGVRLSDEVYGRLLALISKGVLGPGEKLWPEREMAERFQVSRQSVREALNRAKLFGLVEVRPGAGAYIRSLIPDSLTHPLSELLHRETDRVLEFLQVRKVLEGWCAAEATVRAKRADLHRLTRCLTHMARIAREGGLLGKPDVEFHLAIAEATHNTVMAHIVNSLHGMFLAVLRVRFVVRKPARTRLLVTQHEAILDAIRRRDRTGATKAMVAHLEFIEEEIRDFCVAGDGWAERAAPGVRRPAARRGTLAMPRR